MKYIKMNQHVGAKTGAGAGAGAGGGYMYRTTGKCGGNIYVRVRGRRGGGAARYEVASNASRAVTAAVAVAVVTAVRATST